MIKIIEKTKKSQEPYYLLKVKYMIGDSNGYTEEEGKYGFEESARLEKFCRILDKFKSNEGHWGIVLNDEYERDMLTEGMVTREEQLFYKYVSNEYRNLLKDEELTQEETEMVKGWMKEDEEMEYPTFFGELIRSDAEYSFLVYQGYSLKYVDDQGVKHKTCFV